MRTTLGRSAARCSAGYGARMFTIGCAARKRIASKALVAHRTRLRLNAIGGQHVADGRADDPLQLAGLIAHTTPRRESGSLESADLGVWMVINRLTGRARLVLR